MRGQDKREARGGKGRQRKGRQKTEEDRAAEDRSGEKTGRKDERGKEEQGRGMKVRKGCGNERSIGRMKPRCGSIYTGYYTQICH